ncbi:MAG: Trk system potassium transporter TrkA [Saprospiraceae bacterium]|nr:Trk system potassium transporter TrkA [Saprospiraceae bacterium]
MKIVIAGAGDIGFHIAKLLTFEKQDITLIDTDGDVLDHARTHLDVLTVKGDSSSFTVLQDAEVDRARLVIAATTSEKTNIITAILAKKMGAKQTIARVQSQEYLAKDQKAIFLELGVDSLISPQQLAAYEVLRLIKQCSLTDIFEFEGGQISLIGVLLDDSSPIVNMSIREVDVVYDKIVFKPIALLRGHQTIIPNPNTILRRNDHIYFLARNEDISTLVGIVGKDNVVVKNIMIIGGTELALKTAQLLEEHYNVLLIEKDKVRCKALVQDLHDTLVVCADPSNLNELEEEGLKKMDAVVALSDNSESNIIASLMAEEAGVYKTIALVSNTHYVRLSQNIGVDTLINEKLIAANNIFRFVRKGNVEAITSIHGSDAEIIEFSVTKGHRVTKRTLADLHLPASAVVGSVLRGKEALIPDDDFTLQSDDKVIIFALPEAISIVEKIFR